MTDQHALQHIILKQFLAQTGPFSAQRVGASSADWLGHGNLGTFLGACSSWGAQGPRIHSARTADRGGRLYPLGGPCRSGVHTGGIGVRTKVVLHITQVGSRLVGREARHVSRRPGGQFLAIRMLHLGDSVTWG